MYKKTVENNQKIKEINRNVRKADEMKHP